MSNPPQPVAVLMNALQRGLRRVADASAPPEARLLGLTTGVSATQIIRTIAELDIAEAIGGREVETREVAHRTGCDPDATHRLLRAASALGICTMNKRTGKVRMTRVGRTLHRNHQASMHDWAVYMGSESTNRAWCDLTASVRTGESAFPRVHGKSVWDWFQERPTEGALFAGAMRELTRMIADVVADATLIPDSGTVCDLCGGTGTLLHAILERHHAVRGILLDAQGPVDDAVHTFTEQNAEGRIDFVAGNIFDSIDATADVYLLKDILHDWNDEACGTILENLYAAMPDGSRVIVVEVVQENNTPNPFAPFIDLQMLTQTDGGRQRTVPELAALVATARLTPTGRKASAYAYTLFEAVKTPA